MFLATTALTEFWDTSDEILFLGPWCLRYDRREDWLGLKYTVLQNPWTVQRRIRQAEAYCNDVIEHLLSELIPLLNHTHATHHSQRYWRIILGPWLLYYVHALYDRFVHIREALRSVPDARTICLDSECFKTPTDTLDFVRLAYEDCADLFNLQLYSQILPTLGWKGPTRKPICCPQPVQGDLAIRDKLKTLTRLASSRALLKLATLVRPDVWLGGIGMNWRELWRLTHTSGLRLWPVTTHPPLFRNNTLPDPAMRKVLREIRVIDEFQNVLRETLPQNFPLLYLEGYRSFRDRCLRVVRARPKIMVSSADWYSEEAFKFIAAECSEYGTKLVGVQHGAGYGMSKTIPQERYEWSIVDSWYSYGWKPPGSDSKVKNIPHPRFMPLKETQFDRRQKQNTDILLAATTHPRYPFRFESYPVGAFDSVLGWRKRFVFSLSDDIRAHLIVRLNRPDYGWCHQERLVDSCGFLRFNGGEESIRKAMRKARLLVIEYHGTTMLEALAADLPTVLFWDPKDWEFREEAEPYIDDLRKVGILWDTPEGAAAKVVDVYDHPWPWWQGEAVQEVRRRFVDRYALGRSNWMDCWVRALQEETALGN